MGKVILVKSDNGSPQLFVRSVHSYETEDGRITAYNITEPVLFKNGPQMMVASEFCFEYDKQIFDEVTALFAQATNAMATAICWIDQLDPVDMGPDAIPEDLAWAGAIQIYH